MKKPLLGILALSAYLAVAVGANVATSRYGFVPVGFGLLATAGTYCAGAALFVRDLVQDAAGRWVVLGALAVAAVLSAVLATPALAVASGVAFGVAELLDLIVYTPLRRRGWVRAVVASNVVGGIADTFLFLWLAGFPITASVVSGQLVGKAWLTLIPLVLVLAVRRAVLRQPVHAADSGSDDGRSAGDDLDAGSGQPAPSWGSVGG